MKKKLFIIWTTLLIAMLTFSPVYAGGVSITWGGGSIIGEGYAYGFSRDEVKITLAAEGIPHIICIDPGNNGNVVPGQNPVPVLSGQDADIDLTADEKGKFYIELRADVEADLFTPKEWGCPNDNWIVVVDWVDWYWTSITVIEKSTGDTLWYKEYSCVTTPPPGYDVNCNAIKFK